MELVIGMLVLALVALLLTPTEEEPTIKDVYKVLGHCDKHIWVDKENGLGSTYKVCDKCRFLPESGLYEEKK